MLITTCFSCEQRDICNSDGLCVYCDMNYRQFVIKAYERGYWHGFAIGGVLTGIGILLVRLAIYLSSGN